MTWNSTPSQMSMLSVSVVDYRNVSALIERFDVPTVPFRRLFYAAYDCEPVLIRTDKKNIRTYL